MIENTALTSHENRLAVPIFRRTHLHHGLLTESVTDSNECISLTLWDNQEHMEAYGSRGKFKQFHAGVESVYLGHSRVES